MKRTITKAEAHELYIELVNIQAQLENDIGNEADLENDKKEIRAILHANGYNPDCEPESCYPENQ